MITKAFLDLKLIELGPTLLKGFYRKKWTPENPTLGYCYLVSEALYHYVLLESESYVMNFGHGIGTHWFLKNGDTIVDLTGDQFGFKVPYSQARRCAFLVGSVPTPRGTISKNGFLFSKFLKVV